MSGIPPSAMPGASSDTSSDDDSENDRKPHAISRSLSAASSAATVPEGRTWRASLPKKGDKKDGSDDEAHNDQIQAPNSIADSSATVQDATPATESAPSPRARQAYAQTRPQETYSELVREPNDLDCLFGRGKPFQLHPGNKRFLRIVDGFKARYLESKRRDKKPITERIVQLVKKNDDGPPFRFMKRLCDIEADQAVAATEHIRNGVDSRPAKKNVTGRPKACASINCGCGWVEVSDEAAIIKVSHTLRSRWRRVEAGLQPAQKPAPSSSRNVSEDSVQENNEEAAPVQIPQEAVAVPVEDAPAGLVAVDNTNLEIRLIQQEMQSRRERMVAMQLEYNARMREMQLLELRQAVMADSAGPLHQQQQYQHQFPGPPHVSAGIHPLMGAIGPSAAGMTAGSSFMPSFPPSFAGMSSGMMQSAGGAFLDPRLSGLSQYHPSAMLMNPGLPVNEFGIAALHQQLGHALLPQQYVLPNPRLTHPSGLILLDSQPAQRRLEGDEDGTGNSNDASTGDGARRHPEL